MTHQQNHGKITTLIFNLQIQFVVGRGKSGKGFVALDDIEFKFIELCEFTPQNAKPITTTKTPPTTYPPNCMYYKCDNFC